jgi:hypothetical protein
MNIKKLSSPIVPRNVVAIMAAKRFALSAYPSTVILCGAACSDISVAPWCVLVYLLGHNLSDTLDQTYKLRVADYCPTFTHDDERACAFPAQLVNASTFACVCSAVAQGKFSLWSIAAAAAAALALNTGIHLARDLARAAELLDSWTAAGAAFDHQDKAQKDEEEETAEGGKE